MHTHLENGTVLPAIAAKDLEGNAVDLGESVRGDWAAVLLYRGDF